MKFLKNHYDAVCILGGGLKKEGGVWRTPRFDEGDNFGPTGDNIRVIAGSYLLKQGLTSHLIASGGRGQYKDIPEAPTLASVIKKELIDLGVEPDNIEEEGQSGNTYQQLKALQDIVVQRGWDSIGIISNRYHLPRIQAMIEYGPRLSGLNRVVNLISAENVLLTYAPSEWKKIIEEAYRSNSMKKRIKLETAGVNDIKNGKYKFH